MTKKKQPEEIEAATDEPVDMQPGHNAQGGIAADRLRSIIERHERLYEERKALTADMADIMSEAKSAGFDVKVIRQIMADRRQEAADIEERETLKDVYRRALGY